MLLLGQPEEIDENSAMQTHLEAKNCEDLETSEMEALRRLKIAGEQIEFGGSFEDSLAIISDIPAGCGRALCIMMNKTPVGIVVLKRPPVSPDWVPRSAVSVHGLKIAEPWQGLGLGKQAFRLAAQRASAIWPDAKNLVLSVDAANLVALSLYRSFGMSDSGPVFSGRIGLEHRFEIGLGPQNSMGSAG